ncbi:hypothetical protein MBLNU13_g01588t2 [Cladosporium sp. NU13]
MTLSGLGSINLSVINTFQQIMLFVLIMMGSAIFVSAFVVHIRKRAFEKKFRIVVEKKRLKDGTRRRTTSLHRTSVHELGGMRRPSATPTSKDDRFTDEDKKNVPPLPTPGMSATTDGNDKSQFESAIIDGDAEDSVDSPHLTFSRDTRFRPSNTSQVSPRRRSRLSFGTLGVGARRGASMDITSVDDISTARSVNHNGAIDDSDKDDADHYFDAAEGWTSRNSQFHGLNAKERERLGGYEYRAVALLAWLVPAYYILFQLLGCLGCAAWVAHNRPETARGNGLDPWWLGAFNAVSAFNNSGMSLLDANMTAFQTGYYLLITMGFLILAGNTCYPIFLRLIVWTMLKIVECLDGEVWGERAATLRFLLDHPRRCYTNLFPSQHTWWLLLMVITLNGIDWAAFEILNIGNPKIDGVLPVNVRVIDGLFQAFAVRSGGFFVVTISDLRISLQVLYVVMMYISVYPVVITMRNSNVYEERSLGIYAEDAISELDKPCTPMPQAEEDAQRSWFSRARFMASNLNHARPQESNTTFVRHQLRAQLAHDAWTIILALFLIMIIESRKFSEDPTAFSVFNFLFEIVSGYGAIFAILTVLGSAEDASVSAMASMVSTAMPPYLSDAFFATDGAAGNEFAVELMSEFDRGKYPPWLAQLPQTVQTYFISRWMSAVLDSTDLLGSSSTVVTALVLTRGSGGITSTVAGSATFARSQSWHYMSFLNEHVPAAVQILTNGGSSDFATAVYRQFTSGTAPSWFQAMPTDVQSYVVLDYLPNWLNEPMALDWLALASPAARPTGTTGPTATIKLTPVALNQASSRRGTVIAAILIPLFILPLVLGSAIFFIRYRRRRRARSLASSLPPLDPEQAVRRWSETTFGTAVSPREQRHQSSFLPPTH